MCKDCGCADHADRFVLADITGRLELAPAPKTVSVMSRLLSGNDADAEANRRLFDAHGILVVNLMSSPGSGKTALLEATIEQLAGRYRIAVIEGDLETENDAKRIRAKGVPAVQIITGQTCHLDAKMVRSALTRLEIAAIDILFIENVGNLVCPASFDLGEHAKVALLAVTEGDDKPAKYPVMFHSCDLVLLSKADLLPVLDDFSPEAAEAHVRQLANPAPVLQISARRPANLSAWVDWLDARLVQTRVEKPAA